MFTRAPAAIYPLRGVGSEQHQPRVRPGVAIIGVTPNRIDTVPESEVPA